MSKLKSPQTARDSAVIYSDDEEDDNDSNERAKIAQMIVSKVITGAQNVILKQVEEEREAKIRSCANDTVAASIKAAKTLLAKQLQEEREAKIRSCANDAIAASIKAAQNVIAKELEEERAAKHEEIAPKEIALKFFRKDLEQEIQSVRYCQHVR